MTKIKTYPLTLEYGHRNIQRLEKLAIEYNSTMSQIVNAMIKTFYDENEKLKKSEKKKGRNKK